MTRSPQARRGRRWRDVERTAGSLREAIRSAIADAESIPGLWVVRVEPEEHVSQAELADLVREAVGRAFGPDRADLGDTDGSVRRLRRDARRSRARA